MFPSFSKKIPKVLVICLSSIILGVVFSYGFYLVNAAWSDAISNPPTCPAGSPGCDPPLNVSITPQTKTGNLVVNALGISGAGNALLVPNGNVGIGTTGPNALLHIYKASDPFVMVEAGGGDYPYLRLKTPSSGDGYLIKNIATGNSLLDKSLYLWNSNGPIQFVTSGTASNAVTIDTNGNIGIGTTNPTGKLEVSLVNTSGWSGNLKGLRLLSPDSSYYLDLNTYIVGSGNVGYQFSPNTNTGLVITTPGNVGIGVTGPANKLDVNGNIRAGSAGAGGVYLGNRGYYIGDDLGGSDIQTNAPNFYVYDGAFKRLLREGDVIYATYAP